jgi:hypothetical protein
MQEGGCEESHHIVIGSMALSTISLGKSVIQASNQREEICMGSYNNFRQSCFLMNIKQIIGKKIFGVGETMEGELWSIFGEED